MNAFDSFLIGLWFLSIVYGYFQGIAKAVSTGLSLLVSSVYIAFLFLNSFRQFLLEFSAHDWVTMLSLPILTIIIMIIIKTIGAIFGQIAQRTHTKFIDDGLGAFWGVVRGAAIIKLIFLAVSYAGMYKLLETSIMFPWFSSMVKVF